MGYELLGANPTNPHGHFEDAEAIELHDNMLAACGKDWMVAEDFTPQLTAGHREQLAEFASRRNAEHATWGFKDPRVNHFLTEWRAKLPDAKVLIVFRDPVECVDSLHRRHAREFVRLQSPSYPPFFTEPDLALRMWISANEALLRFARQNPNDVLVVSNAALMSGYRLVDAINDRWDFGLGDSPVSEVLDPSLSKSAEAPLAVEDTTLRDKIIRQWSEFLELEDRSAATAETEHYSFDQIKLGQGERPVEIRLENELLRLEIQLLRAALGDAQPNLHDRAPFVLGSARVIAPNTGPVVMHESADSHSTIDADIDYLLKLSETFPFNLMKGRRRKLATIRERFTPVTDWTTSRVLITRPGASG